MANAVNSAGGITTIPSCRTKLAIAAMSEDRTDRNGCLPRIRAGWARIPKSYLAAAAFSDTALRRIRDRASTE
jgi:hypothetical protein